MARWMMTVLAMAMFGLPASAQPTQALQVVPENALAVLGFNDLRQFSAWVESLARRSGARSQLAYLELFVSKELKKHMTDKSSLTVMVLPGKADDALPTPVVAIACADLAGLLRTLGVQDDPKDGIVIGFVDLPFLAWFSSDPTEKAAGPREIVGTRLPVLLAKRGDFILLAFTDERDQLQHVLSARTSIARLLGPATPWMEEQDVFGVCTPAGLKAALPHLMADAALRTALEKNAHLITLGARIEKEGHARLSARLILKDTSLHAKRTGKLAPLDLSSLSSTSDEAYLVATLARLSADGPVEQLVAQYMYRRLPSARTADLTTAGMRVLRRISDVALSLHAEPKKQAGPFSLRLKVDDAPGFVAEAADFLKKHCEALDESSDLKVVPLQVADKLSVLMTLARKNDATIVVMTAIDTHTVLVGTLRQADQAETFIKHHLAKPTRSLDANPELQKTFSLLSRPTQLATFVNVKNLFAANGMSLRDGPPLGIGVSMPAGAIEAHIAAPVETVELLVEAANKYGNPPLVQRDLPISTRTAEGRQATTLFWTAFHGNDYARTNAVIQALSTAFNNDPQDAIVARLLGATHGWKFMERGRDRASALTLIPNGLGSLTYLTKSAMLDPKNRVLPAIQECALIMQASMLRNQKQLDTSLEQLRKNADRDPTMHGFVQGWVFSALLNPADDRYQGGVDAFFATLDHSNGFPVPRRFPASGPVINTWLAWRSRTDSAVYNNDVAPHNLEGTYLGLGDALLKQGKIAAARRAYEGVKASPNYSSWKYQPVLENRLANLEKLGDRFRAQKGQLDVAEPAMFFQSSFACTACHAK